MVHSLGQIFRLFLGEACKEVHHRSKLRAQSGPPESAKFNRQLTLLRRLGSAAEFQPLGHAREAPFMNS